MRLLQKWGPPLMCEISWMRGVRQHAGSQQEESGLIQWPALSNFIVAGEWAPVTHESGADVKVNTGKFLIGQPRLRAE